jgi:hypothetical protein
MNCILAVISLVFLPEDERRKRIIMVKSKLDENNDDEKGSSMFRRLYPSILHILFPDFFVSFSVVFLLSSCQWRREMMGKLAMAIGASFFSLFL